MQISDMIRSTADAVESRLMYTDGISRIVFTTHVEVPFPEGRLIVSCTDLKGILTHANDAFVELSGLEHDDLIGKPQHILRHPDMPKAAYKDLWNTIIEGKKWYGFVKNLRKDGSCYWVYATVVPNIRQGKIAGYTWVRRKPSRTRIEEMIPVYRQWLAQEYIQDSEKVAP